MKTKNLVLIALLLGMGTVLSVILSLTFAGMRPDVLLTMMFIAILLFPERKHVLLIGLATGFLSGMISTFPGGFIPNIIDKLVTAFVCLGLILLLKKLTPIVSAGIVSVVGTLVSGVVFLTSALIIVSLPAPFLALFSLVVLPAVALNTILIIVLYPIVQTILKRSNFEPLQKSA